MSTKKLTTEEFITRAKKLHGAKFDYTNAVYVNATTKTVVTCPIHGDFLVLPRDHIHAASGCPQCAGKKQSWCMVRARIQAKHPNKFTFATAAFTNITSPLTGFCLTHKGAFTSTAKLLLRGHGCPVCSPTRKLSLAEYTEKAHAVHGTRYTYAHSSQLRNNKTCITITCAEHGLFIQQRDVHLKGHGCPKCAVVCRANQLKKSTLAQQEALKENLSAGFVYDLSAYTNLKGHIEVTCPKGHQYTQSFEGATQFGCPICSAKVSKIETTLADYIAQFHRISRTDRTLIRPAELDIVIPDKKLAVEFNGVYYHSTGHWPLDKAKAYHKAKTDACARVGYRLLHVFENDWVLHRSRVEHALRYALGVLPVVGARKCTFRPASAAAAAKFLNLYHLQGDVAASIHLGLWLDDELVSVMSLGVASSVRGNKDSTLWELKRFASKYAIAGGAQRLFKAFIAAYPQATRVVSYVDLSWFAGDMYYKLGFTKTHEVAPEYKIYHAGNIPQLHHKTYTKKANLMRLLGAKYDAKKTEYAMTQENNMYRVYDCGKLRFDWVRS